MSKLGNSMIILKVIQKTFEGMHRGYDYGVRSKEEEKIIKFCASMNITGGNPLVKKSGSYLVPSEFGASKETKGETKGSF